jgi:hypothetical protein
MRSAGKSARSAEKVYDPQRLAGRTVLVLVGIVKCHGATIVDRDRPRKKNARTLRGVSVFASGGDDDETAAKGSIVNSFEPRSGTRLLPCSGP